MKRQKVGCGRIRVRLERPDPDLEPDEVMLQEKLSLLESHGITMPLERGLCSCSGEVFFIPADLLTSLRVFAMTETELYFAPAGRACPGDSPAAGQPNRDAGPAISSRNEIRALMHLSKLIAACTAGEQGGGGECTGACVREVVELSHKVSLDGLPDGEGKAVPDPRESKACAEFEAWCRDEGVSTALTVMDFDDGTGRGLAASRDLEAGEFVVKTPFHLFLNTEDLGTSRFCHVFRAVRGLDAKASHILCIMMEDADAENSPWKHYLESCPRTLFNSLLIPDEHLTLLQGSPALDFLVERKTEFREMYDALFPKLSDAFPKELPPHKCAWEDFLWAAAIIDTRAWATDAGCDVSSLVPCCDMLNHHRCAQGMVKRYDSDEGFAAVQLLSPVQKGKQVFVYYGELTTASQLLRFGFADPDDPYDTVPFELDLSETSQDQMAAMRAWGLRPDTQQLLRRGGPLSQRMLAMLRILHLETEADSQTLSAISAKCTDPRWQLTPENEANVAATLGSLVHTMVGAYPTRLEEDEEMLKSPTLSEGERACLGHIVSQKKVLADALRLARALVGQ